MKIKKKHFEALKKMIREEIKNAEGIRSLVAENILKNKNRLLPSEWEEFKERFLKDNKDHKIVSGKTKYGDRFEAIVKKSNEREAVIKYLPDDMDAMHDMKPARFFDYIR